MFKLDTVRKKKKKKKKNNNNNNNNSSGSLFFNEPLKPIVFTNFTSLALTRACAEPSWVELPEKHPHSHTPTHFHCVETADGETLGWIRDIRLWLRIPLWAAAVSDDQLTQTVKEKGRESLLGCQSRIYAMDFQKYAE